NEEYDAVVDQIKVEQDSSVFAELVLEADAIASSEYPVLPLYYKTNTYLLKDYVEGVYMIASGSYYFKDAYVLAH
ncbi:MAG: peptide ABC transporter substrate-binding protein, partial [Lachnospiraceae bacterium]|nr:peptide ABC transporter substrate-binding protein [Lachnospiraceae bacterium]